MPKRDLVKEASEAAKNLQVDEIKSKILEKRKN